MLPLFPRWLGSRVLCLTCRSAPAIGLDRASVIAVIQPGTLARKAEGKRRKRSDSGSRRYAHVFTFLWPGVPAARQEEMGLVSSRGPCASLCYSSTVRGEQRLQPGGCQGTGPFPVRRPRAARCFTHCAAAAPPWCILRLPRQGRERAPRDGLFLLVCLGFFVASDSYGIRASVEASPFSCVYEGENRGVVFSWRRLVSKFEGCLCKPEPRAARRRISGSTSELWYHLRVCEPGGSSWAFVGLVSSTWCGWNLGQGFWLGSVPECFENVVIFLGRPLQKRFSESYDPTLTVYIFLADGL